MQLDNDYQCHCHQDHLRPRAAEVKEQRSKPSFTDDDLAGLFPAMNDGSGDQVVAALASTSANEPQVEPAPTIRRIYPPEQKTNANPLGTRLIMKCVTLDLYTLR